MAIPFVQSIDMNDFQILNFVVHSSGSAPTNTNTTGGMMWWDSTNKVLNYYNDTLTAWRPVIKSPASTTVNYVPQWGDTTGISLTTGLLLATTVGSPGVDTSIVSEQGIREALDAIAISALEDIGDVDAYSSITTGELIQWDGNSWLHQTFAEMDIAYHDGTPTTNGIPQWSATEGQLTDGLTLATTVGSPGSDTILVSEQGIREAIDAATAGLDVKESVVCNSDTTSTEGTGYSYVNTGGTSGRGQITWTAGPTVIDGVTLVNGDRILNSETGAAGGIWVRTAANTWDRATDFDEDDEVTANAYTFVEEGTNYADDGWVLTTNDPIIIGGVSGTSLAWSQFSGLGTYTAGNGLDLSSGEFSVDLKANGGLVIESTELAIDLGASSITGTLAVGDGGTGRITSTTAYGLITAGTTATGVHQTIVTGLSGQFLRSGGASALPAWSTTTIPATILEDSILISNAANILTALQVGNGQSIRLNAGGTAWEAFTPSSGIGNHNLLNNTEHPDTATAAVSRGSLIVGKTVTPIWDELVIGTAARHEMLLSDGTDAVWGTIATLTNETTLADTDEFIFYDASVTDMRALTYSGLKAALHSEGFAKVVKGIIALGASPIITHNFNLTAQNGRFTDFIVQVWRQSDGKLVNVEVTDTTKDTATLSFGSAGINPTGTSFRFVAVALQE